MVDVTVQPGSSILGKYRVVRVLGQGGMGRVIAVRHVELGGLFAIKLLLLDVNDKALAANRFIREARAAAQLKSDHAARVYDVGRLDNGTPYLVMEYLDGENLGKVLMHLGSLPFEDAALLVLQACEAIAEAHSQGIVHRDLKPTNLFLARGHNGKTSLKVIDFGISKQTGDSEQLTKPGDIMGSPYYMSPEQIITPQGVDGRSDIWALGVILYQLTTGSPPFQGENLPNLIQRVLHATPEPPSRLRPTLPPALDDVIACCLQKRPERRYATVEDFAVAVRAIAPLPDKPRPIALPPPPVLVAHPDEPTGTMLPSPNQGNVAPREAPRVFISCRSDMAEDLDVAASFHGHLSTAGINSFLASKDVHNPSNWVKDVTQALQDCQLFLLLLSRHSGVSEMVAAEFEMAWQLHQRPVGAPQLLVVRVHLSEDTVQGHVLRERLLDVEQREWSGPQDTPAIVALVLERLGRRGPRQEAPPNVTAPLPPIRPPHHPAVGVPLELPGGVVSSQSAYYVPRPQVEGACRREILNPGALIRIKGPRQMGKTSLMMSLADHAAQEGARTVLLHLQLADVAILADQNRLLRWLCAVATRRLKLPVQRMDEQWDDIFGAKDNCTAYFEEHLLTAEAPLVLLLDGVDRVFESPDVAEEFLTLLRAWHEMGRGQSPWRQLRLVLGYSTEMYLPLQINHSPFNVGLPVVLSEWDSDTVQELAERHGLSWSRMDVEQVMHLLGGHPHLIRIAMYHAANHMPLSSVLSMAATDEGLFADHLKSLLWHVRSRPELHHAVRHVMASVKPVGLDTELAFKLVSLGLVHLQGNEVLPARNLYRLYFTGRLSTP